MMYPLTKLLSVSMDPPHLIEQVLPTLHQQGWQVIQSFDLQTARQAHTGCSCLHHGTDRCSCQMAIYLLYREAGKPLTLIAHGRDGSTDLSLVDDPAHTSFHHLANRLRQMFLTAVHPTVDRSLIDSQAG